jgi:hypothetical protein
LTDISISIPVPIQNCFYREVWADDQRAGKKMLILIEKSVTSGKPFGLFNRS